MNKNEAQKIIDSVHKAYNTVADPFVASRVRDWNEFEIMISHIHHQGILLDAGCAHGRLIPFLLKHDIQREFYTGIDISENLITKAREMFPGIRFDIGDVCHLPYTDNSFDTVISSAVLHHIPSEEFRVQVLHELYRVTKPGGKIILLVWNAFYFKHLWKEIMTSYVKSFFSFGKYESGDMYLPFFGKETSRYVHAFTSRSLKKILQKALGKNIPVTNTGKNFFVVIEK